MNNFQDQDPLLWTDQILEKERVKLLNEVKDEAIEALRKTIDSLDVINNSLKPFGEIFPDQKTTIEKAQTGFSIANSYLAEALNDMIVNPQTIKVSSPDLQE